VPAFYTVQVFHEIHSRRRAHPTAWRLFLATKNLKMKTTLFFLLIFLFAAAPLAAQRTARIVQMRPEQVKLPELGKAKMYFVEAEVNGSVELLLISAAAPIAAGDQVCLVEAHDTPRHIVVFGARYYCYMSKYLRHR
jgi:hypothetical protein